MGRTRWPWIADTFNARKVHFPDGTIWELGQKLSEADQQRYPPCEARAVYVSTQLTGPHIGTEAIIKVRMQYVIFRPPCLPQSTEHVLGYLTAKLHIQTPLYGRKMHPRNGTDSPKTRLLL